MPSSTTTTPEHQQTHPSWLPHACWRTSMLQPPPPHPTVHFLSLCKPHLSPAAPAAGAASPCSVPGSPSSRPGRHWVPAPAQPAEQASGIVSVSAWDCRPRQLTSLPLEAAPHLQITDALQSLTEGRVQQHGGRSRTVARMTPGCQLPIQGMAAATGSSAARAAAHLHCLQ